MRLIEWVNANPVPTLAVISFLASVCLKGFRRAYPEPLETMPRWARFVEGALDAVACNSSRQVQKP